MTTAPPPGTLAPEARDAGAGARRGAPYGQVLAIAMMLALAAFLAVMGVVILAARPQVQGLGAFAGLVNQQNETAKSLLYLLTFLVILPLAVVLAGRLADSIAAGPNAPALPTLTALMAAGLAAALIAVRLSHRLPWGDGLKVLLAAVALWALGAGVALARASRGGPWPSVLALRSIGRGAWPAATVLVFGALLCVTHRGSLHVVPLALGAVVGLSLLIAGSRLRLPAIVRRRWVVLDSSVRRARCPRGGQRGRVSRLGAAAEHLSASGSDPEPAGLSARISKSAARGRCAARQRARLAVRGGVDLFPGRLVSPRPDRLRDARLARLDPDGVVLRQPPTRCCGSLEPAGRSPRWLLRLPSLAWSTACSTRWARCRRRVHFVSGCRWRWCWRAWRRCAGRDTRRSREGFALGALGLAAVWAFEAFAYTVLVFVAIAAVQAWLAPAGERRRWLVGQALRGAVACVVAHLLLALVTLLGTGHLPDWGQYLTYIRSFLLGGQAGAISYGFARWSPGLAVGAGTVASAAALVLLVLRGAADRPSRAGHAGRPGREHRLRDRAAQLRRQPLVDLPAALRHVAAADRRRAVAGDAASPARSVRPRAPARRRRVRNGHGRARDHRRVAHDPRQLRRVRAGPRVSRWRPAGGHAPALAPPADRPACARRRTAAEPLRRRATKPWWCCRWSPTSASKF